MCLLSEVLLRGVERLFYLILSDGLPFACILVHNVVPDLRDLHGCGDG
jgi:hypothetical protein